MEGLISNTQSQRKTEPLRILRLCYIPQSPSLLLPLSLFSLLLLPPLSDIPSLIAFFRSPSLIFMDIYCMLELLHAIFPFI